MKLSILMPTYNDSETIIESLDSVNMQRNKNWELIIINDGSTDETEKIVKNYIKNNNLNNKVNYIYQDNQDQLRAILNGSNYITGDYVMFLHSDDIFASENTIDYIFDEFNKNPKVDSLLHDLLIMDKDCVVNGEQKIKKYSIDKNIPPLQLLFLGRNLYTDCFVAKKSFFLKEIKNNYLTWNRPFWLSIDEEIKMANVKNISQNLVKYRVYEENYINNELGKLNVINGELRTAISLMYFYDIPNYKMQFFLYRLLNKLKLNYHVFYRNSSQKNMSSVIEFIYDKRFSEKSWKENIFLNNLYQFYKNYQDRTITISKIDSDEFIFYGCDMRKFNKLLMKNELPKIYVDLLNEMKSGFNKVIIKKDDKDKVKAILKFLCIDKFVLIKEEQ
jgi:glycosyltransferase involved in cell wall biosynthesis